MTENAKRATAPFWEEDAEISFDLEPLREDTHADVCVVGAGIAGLSVAYHLARVGKDVVVLEAKQPGSGETACTTAHLASALDDRFTELERLFGEAGSRRAAESHAAAIDRIEEIVREEGIACNFTRTEGYLFEAPDGTVDLREELAAAQRAGLDVTWLDQGPISLYPGRPCLRFANQAQFHPLRYLAGLARAFRERGGRLYGQSPVMDFQDGAPVRAVTRDGRCVEADALVVATNTPVNDWIRIHTRQAAYRTYAVLLTLPQGKPPHGLFWDTADPYHYVRLVERDGGRPLLLAGGEDHKTGQGGDERACLVRLESWTREHFPQAGKVVAQWSGQVLEPADSLALIGKNPGSEHVFIVTGDSGHGLTHGTIAGMLLTDLILGRSHPWADLYSPGRSSLRAAGTLASENLNVAARYVEWLTPGDDRDPEQLAPGEGIVVRKGMRKLAVCKDTDGAVHQVSAVCPHLGCIVHWNQAEMTWDCPCHGSRFKPGGEVLHGPALSGLKQVEQHKEPEPAGEAQQ